MFFWWFFCPRTEMAKPRFACTVLQIHYFWHVRKTWMFMIFLSFSATNFCIDVWCVFASISGSFWWHFGVKFRVFWWSFFPWFSGWHFSDFCVKMLSKRVPNGDRNAARKVQESDQKPCRRTYSLWDSILAWFWTDLGGFWSDFGSMLQGFLKDLGVVILSLISCV